jgi:hypothetical protein
MKKILLLLTMTIASITFFTSCDKDKGGDDKTPATGKTVEINVASSWATWNYFSFSQGKVVGTGDASLESDAEWAARVDWDIAFTRLYARTNSGKSGGGKGGVVEIGVGNDDKASVFANLKEAPTSGYIVDEIVENIMISMGGSDGPGTYASGSSSTINSWLKMGMPVEVTPKVFAIKTADGKCAKIYLKGYENEDGVRCVIMEYLYQADGSANLSVDK